VTVKMWRCPEHGPVASKVIVGRDGIPRCPECGQRMVAYSYGSDPPPNPRQTFTAEGPQEAKP